MTKTESRWAEAQTYISEADRKLAKVIKAAGPCTLKPQRRSPYEALVRAVAHQQLHGKAAETILARFVALYPDDNFPTPERLLKTPPAKIRACGFSEAKVLALRDIAAKTEAGIIPDRKTCTRLENEQIIERLTQARGVGRWTVEMFLMFTLCRPDVLPVDDFGIREGYRLMHKQPDQPKPRELAEVGSTWAPWRTVASWYLWRAVELYR
jgi:DNA-3-methyladenine glycosylase II